MKGGLPAAPGVYVMKDASGKILYIGKATSLKTRVASYFSRPADARIAKMVGRIAGIEYLETPTAVEALILEARLIKKHQPPFNVMEKDDKSFVHLAFTRETYPRPVLIRGHELARLPKRHFLRTFGPFNSTASVQAALDTLRRSFPWSRCRPPSAGARSAPRPCFYRHLGLCPGVCTGDIAPADYRRIVSQLMRFFAGGRRSVTRDLEKAMRSAAEAQRFEEAAGIRNRLRALEHIQDIAVLKREDAALDEFIDVFGRIEGYDISNISGRDAVGSMAVFVDGRPRRSEYRRFLIKSVTGTNDTAMLEEVLNRRFARSSGAGREKGGRSWPLPDLVLVDGGAGQVNAARRVLKRHGLRLPVVGMAKGPDRKRDELIFDKGDYELSRLTAAFKPLLQRLRDEAHRSAVSYHRRRRALRYRPS